MLSPAKIPQLAWNAGEIAQNRQGRIDIDKYRAGCHWMVNFIVGEGGEFEARPGTGFIAEASDHDDAPRLLDFVFNDIQSYIVEMGDEIARFFMSGGQITVDTPAPGTIYEIVTPYAIADASWLQTSQRHDVMFIAGGARGYAPYTLSRAAHANWSCDPWTCDTGPFLDPNVTTITLTPSAIAAAATGTLTASAAFFDPGHVGALFRIEEDDTNGYSMWEPVKSYTAGDVARYGANVYVCTTSGTSGAVAPIHTHGKRWDGKISASAEWEYLHSGYGVCRVTGYNTPTSVNITVLSQLPSTGAVRRWREGAFSAYRGYPVAVALAGRRLYWLGTRTMPRTGWGSVAGDVSDFTPGPLADDAVMFTLESNEANPIRSAAERGVLYVFTAKRAYQITGTGGGPIKPDDIVSFACSSAGSNGVQPVNVGRGVLFVDQSGQALQELSFTVDADDDAARNLSKLATHIMRPGG